MPVFPLTISRPRNAEAWSRCEELAWSRTDVVDYSGERSDQYNISMKDRIAAADDRARAVFRFIERHPGCSPANIPTCNVRVKDVITRLELAGLVQRKYRIESRDCGMYRREYRVVALYACNRHEED